MYPNTLKVAFMVLRFFLRQRHLDLIVPFIIMIEHKLHTHRCMDFSFPVQKQAA